MRHALACHAFVITTLLYASVLAVDTIPRDLSLPTAAYPIVRFPPCSLTTQ